MAKKRVNQIYYYGGIAESAKIGAQGSFFFGKRLNIHDEASQIKILPAPAKVSGTTVTDLIKWIVSGTPHDTNKYFYSEGGKIYRETSGGTWSSLQTTANSNGQGLEVSNDYLYYTQNTQIGRYGPLSNSPAFDDDWQTGLNDTSTTKFAPIKSFKEGFVVGHGNYVGWWDGATWDADALVLPAGLNVRSLEIIDEFVVIGTWRGTSITANEEAYLFFWDGVSSTFNYFISLPEGACNALVNSKNRLFSILGSSGNLYLNYRPTQKVQQIPKMTIDKYLEILPGAITNWQNRVHIGVSGNTDSTSVIQGVYEWGSKSDQYPEVLNYAYTISTGTETGTTLKIGALKGIGNDLYIAWRDNTTYGVDKVTNSGNPADTAICEGLIFDNGQIYHDKQTLTIKAYHSALATGESIQLGYKTNRATSYTTGTANDTVGSTETLLPVPASAARFKEFQVECILAQTNDTSPTVYYIGFEFEDLEDEDIF